MQALSFDISSQAAQRRAISELLFFASIGDLRRSERICRLWNLKVIYKTFCQIICHT